MEIEFYRLLFTSTRSNLFSNVECFLLNRNLKRALVPETKKRNENRKDSIKEHPYPIDYLPNHDSSDHGRLQRPTCTTACSHDMDSRSEFETTNDHVCQYITHYGKSSSFNASQSLVRNVRIPNETTIVHCHKNQSNLQSKKAGRVLLCTFICQTHKDHPELCTKKDTNGKEDLRESPEQWFDFSSFMCQSGSHKIQKKVNEKTVLKERIEHGCDFSRWTVIPICTDVAKAKQMH
mmetsp:Transcript_182/g.275  ORF Transcript_182/g.275 Transcript_182/m.275 type:complete len:235 (-) Transcript_182:369-1073(-)